MTLVKICGVRSPDDASAIAAAGADLIGLVFAESRRRISLDQAREIIDTVRPARGVFPFSPAQRPGGWFERCRAAVEQAAASSPPLIAGVFADQPLALVREFAEQLDLDFVQLSGDEPWEWAAELPCPVIKVLHVHPGEAADSLLAQVVPGTAAVCMLETGKAGARGGTGESFDWRIAGQFDRVVPVALAGGLTPGNVAEAIRAAGPWLVDVSSGVETNGAKDITKVRSFIEAAKGARRAVHA
jgi:anthranilate synthase/indole-3-glycerol phosphate synthase/phosphoribosylanthranilate isomerase